MSSAVEVYRCGETLERVRVLPLTRVLRGALAPALQRDLTDARIVLYLRAVPAPSEPSGTPPLVNLMPEFGYATVVVMEEGAVTYRHPHTVDELIGRPLRRLLGAELSADQVWGFRITGPDIPALLTRPAPAVEGAVTVERYREDEKPSFRLRRVPEPDPPLAALSDFGVAGESGRLVKVLVHAAVRRQLRELQEFSQELEEGGFLVGRVYRDRHCDGTFLVEVTAAPSARFTGASLLHFTFTGDSFQDVKRTLHGRQGEQLLGWYHTHLFPATAEMGLSTVDLDLHFSTFRKAWQLAGLINLERDGRRTLRFYVRLDSDMALCPQWEVQPDRHPPLQEPPAGRAPDVEEAQ